MLTIWFWNKQIRKMIWSYVTPLSDVCLLLEYLFSDFLCIWNTNFQTLQAGKEMAGKIYGKVHHRELPTELTSFYCFYFMISDWTNG